MADWHRGPPKGNPRPVELKPASRLQQPSINLVCSLNFVFSPRILLSQVILRFTDFKLDGTGYGDYVKVYDGLEENPRRLLRVLTAFDSRAPVAVVSSSGQLRVHFYADKINAARGFNVTYQVSCSCVLKRLSFCRFSDLFCVFLLCRWTGSVCPGRSPVEETGGVTRSSSGATATGTVPTVGTSWTALPVRRTSSPVPETEPATLDRTAATTRTAAPTGLTKRTASSVSLETSTARCDSLAALTWNSVI